MVGVHENHALRTETSARPTAMNSEKLEEY